MTPTDGFLPPASSERKSADRRERLRVLLHTLGERRWLILATAAVIVLVVTLRSAAQDDEYEATAKVLVGQTEAIDALFPGAGAGADPDRIARTNLELIDDTVVAARVAERLSEELSSSDLLDRVEAEIENDSNVVAIRVRDEDPELAAEIANAFATAYARFRQQASSRNLERAIERAQLQLEELEADDLTTARGRTIERRLSDLEIAAALQGGAVEVVGEAEVPDDPVAPRPGLAFLVSIPIGLLAGLLLAALVSYLDRRLKREEQVEAIAHLPVVASIPRRSERLVRRRAGGGVWADPVEAESYGRLATNLRFFNFDRNVKTVLVTSAVPEEGKTTVTLRLAAALAGAGQGVLAVEADLRRPTFTDYFSIQFPHGLSGVLIGSTPFEDVVTRVHTSYALAAPTEEGDDAWRSAPFIEVVPAGVIPPNPTELLAGNSLPAVLEQAKQRADIVLVDSAPLVPVGDAIPVANAVDGVLLVVKLGESRRDELRRALKLLGTLRSKVIGVVITNAERPHDKYDYYSKEPPAPTPAIDPLGPRRRRAAPRFEDRVEENGGGGESVVERESERESD
ncbi:MAG TPA: Wzz/FepE/Etk N-terminal domain-containing protein [Thermoleophilaceae bacterium]|nr:Wzz/FepE/Etk N-terminal domain-containing protein [Thermoleophilaceae bacterium]